MVPSLHRTPAESPLRQRSTPRLARVALAALRIVMQLRPTPGHKLLHGPFVRIRKKSTRRQVDTTRRIRTTPTTELVPEMGLQVGGVRIGRFRTGVESVSQVAGARCDQESGHPECLIRVCAVRRRRFSVGASPTRQPLQPEAIGVAMEVTKWLKSSDSRF